MLEKGEIVEAIKRLGLAGRVVCAHSSYRSFGKVKGGPETIVQSYLDAGCTLVVPTFSYEFEAGVRRDYQQNGWNEPLTETTGTTAPKEYSSMGLEIDKGMGAISNCLVRMPRRIRGEHPIDSFTAMGPSAKEVISPQTPMDIYGPLRKLTALDGAIVLMGVGLDSMTFIHFAELGAGRNLFRRWGHYKDQGAIETQVGGCSDGFPRLERAVAHLKTEATVGKSLWKVFPARKTLEALVQAIRLDPGITHCERTDCERCNDAVKGGPIV